MTGRPTAECGAGQCPQGRLRRRFALGIRPPLTALTSPDDRRLSGGPETLATVGNEEQLRRPHEDEGIGTAMDPAHSVKFRLGNYATFHRPRCRMRR